MTSSDFTGRETAPARADFVAELRKRSSLVQVPSTWKVSFSGLTGWFQLETSFHASTSGIPEAQDRDALLERLSRRSALGPLAEQIYPGRRFRRLTGRPLTHGEVVSTHGAHGLHDRKRSLSV